MPTDPRFDQLTLSAKAALRWAWATAMTRTGAAAPSGVPVDILDLLAGLALPHLGDNPAVQLLAHFHIPPGVLLSQGGTRVYRPETLLAAARRVPEDELPRLDEQAVRVLDYAFTAMPPSSDGLVTLAMLFGALLETSNTASMALRAELANRGADAEPVLRSCREHLGTRSSYAEYLREHHPYRPPEVQLPPYAPDEPRTRRPQKDTADEPPDLIGIGAEVDAFAYLIASKTLTPPLAIGLFGDWGSGKSYFLRSVQRRIDQLVGTEAPKNPPYYRAIAQVEFNAWQYVEGNLWASLLEHLFRNLRLANEDAEDADDLLEARRREYLTQITERTAEHRRAVEERDKLADQRQRVHRIVQNKISERDQKLANLDSARRRNPLLGWRPSATLRTVLDEVEQRTGLGELGRQADELQRTLTSTAETLRRAGPVLGALRVGGWRYALALIVVIGLVPVLSVALGRLDVSAVSNSITSGSVLLAGITALAARGHRLLAGTLGVISRAQAELNAELEARREQWGEEVRRAEIALADTERELDAAVAREEQLAASLAELQAELDRITPSRVLAEFLGQRFASDDYRRHLGVPALVRQDLERLSRLIQARHGSGPGERPEIDAKHAIDRVVLYIDDLDRCPTDLVVKVLEAVHLLLAFPLFVVVVAVDARWLESSLRQHYSQLRADAAVPLDYLEKIFQVPFWVRPLGADTRAQMVRGLLTPNLAGPELVSGAREGRFGDIGMPEADLPEFTRLVQSFGVTDQADQPWLEAAKLTVTGPELRLIEEITPLIGATPRAVKRFINIYLLLKSVGRTRGWPLPDQGQVAVLLAVATGLPELADELLPGLAARVESDPLTLGKALPAAATGQAAAAHLARLTAWLADHPTWSDVPLTGTHHWIDLILRFRFHRVPATAEVAGVSDPGLSTGPDGSDT